MPFVCLKNSLYSNRPSSLFLLLIKYLRSVSAFFTNFGFSFNEIKKKYDRSVYGVKDVLRKRKKKKLFHNP